MVHMSNKPPSLNRFRCHPICSREVRAKSQWYVQHETMLRNRDCNTCQTRASGNGSAYAVKNISGTAVTLIIGVDRQVNKEQHAYPLGFHLLGVLLGFASIVRAKSRRLKSPTDRPTS